MNSGGTGNLKLPEEQEIAGERPRLSGAFVSEPLGVVKRPSVADAAKQSPASRSGDRLETRRGRTVAGNEYNDPEEVDVRAHDDVLAQMKGRLDYLAGQFAGRDNRPPQDDVAELKRRLDLLTEHMVGRPCRLRDEDFAEVNRRLDALAQQVAESRRRAADENLAELKNRLSALIDERLSGGREQAAGQERSGEITARLGERSQHRSDEGADVQGRLAFNPNQRDEHQLWSPEEDLASVNRRLDKITRQLETIAQLNVSASTAAAGERRNAISSEFTGVLASLHQRLDELLTERGAEPTAPGQPRGVLSSTTSLDRALFEIAERQQMLDGELLSRRADLPRAQTQALGSLEQQLRQITKRMEGLKPWSLDQAVETLRGDLAEIRLMLKDALPRNSVEALQTEVRAPGQRIDGTRGAVGEKPTPLTMQAIAGIEELLPGLTARADRIAASPQDSDAVERLAGGDTVMPGLAFDVTSKTALAELGNEVRSLASELEQLARHAADPSPAETGPTVADAASAGPERVFSHAELTPASAPPSSRVAEQAPAPEMVVAALRAAGGSSSSAAPLAITPGNALIVTARASGNPVAPGHRPIDPTLPPDQPLEPRLQQHERSPRPVQSAAERIAASEAALGSAKPPQVAEAAGKADFIAAARRAAQAAVKDAATREENRTNPLSESVVAVRKLGTGMGTRVRTVLVGGVAAVLLLGIIHIVLNWVGPSEPDQNPSAAEQQLQPAANDGAPTTTGSIASTSAGINVGTFLPPSAQFALPTLGDTSLPSRVDAKPEASNTSPAASPPAPATPKRAAAGVAPSGTGTVTGIVTATIRPANDGPGAGVGARMDTLVPRTDQPHLPTVPEGIPAAPGSTLRAAAMKGDPTAEFEIAQRYAEGRGVPQSLSDAADWFERAARKGLVPAQFRLGALYEKGLGVTKNLETARRLYSTAAEAGNAKAMHNLAVLYSEGLEGKPDYQTASKWFRKAADHGVVDSQYNLAILYARGIGVEANLSEAYKWFFLAARDGDKDAGKKRDEVGARLDQPALVAARMAAQVWVATPQPETATEVRVPRGGWDAPPAPAAPARRANSKSGPAPAAPPAQ